MAVAFASVSTATANETSNNSTTLTLTKPTGLAAGDLMIAVLTYSDGTESQFYALTGWTAVIGTDDGDLVTTVLCRVADAGDAAASDFTFTKTAGDEVVNLCGALFRITGAGFTGSANITAQDKGTSSDASAIYTGGITPTADSLLMFIATSGAVSTTASGYAIATSNPTWTERVEITSTDSTPDNNLVIATASRPEATATGDFSLTWAADPGESVGHLLSIQETTNVTTSPAVISVVASVQAPTVTGGATVTVSAAISITAAVQAPTVVTAASEVTNTSRSSAPTWVNTSKS